MGHKLGNEANLDKEFVNKLIEQSKVQQALEQLKTFVKIKGDVENIIIITSLLSQWNEIKRFEVLRSEDNSEITKRKNQIIKSTLEVVNQLK